MVVGCVPYMVRYKCWRIWRPTWRLGLQLTWKRAGSVELPVTRRMKRFHHLIEIAEVMMMMMVQWWSSLDDDPDQVMIQTWWSILDDDPTLIMIHWWSRFDENDLTMKMMKMMKMTWRWIWLNDDPDDTKKKTCADKLCRENTFLVKRECWYICNFGMYSLVYLMYCTLMFISRSIYNVIESCHAPMFRSGDSIM